MESAVPLRLQEAIISTLLVEIPRSLRKRQNV